MASGTNPPSRNFSVLARRNMPSSPAKPPKSRLARQHAPAPAQDGQRNHGQGGREHHAGDGQAIGRGQVRAGLKGKNQHQTPGTEQPIERPNINLPRMFRARVGNVHPSAIAQRDGLRCERVGAGDQRLARDNGRHGRQTHHEDERSRPGHHGIEGRIEDMQLVGQRASALQVPEQKGALPSSS